MNRIVASLLIISIAAACFAQGGKKKVDAPKPDLSGTWVLDESKSRTGRGSDRITDYVLTIEHHEPEIRMSKRFKQGGKDFLIESIYYTDGRPEYNSLIGRWDAAPETRWSGMKLVRKSVTRAEGPVKIEITNREEWILSEDGQTLTRTLNTYGSSGLIGALESLKFVFTRLPRDKGNAAGSTKP